MRWTFQFLRNRRRCIRNLIPTAKVSKDRALGPRQPKHLTENPESNSPDSVSRYLHEMGDSSSCSHERGSFSFSEICQRTRTRQARLLGRLRFATTLLLQRVGPSNRSESDPFDSMEETDSAFIQSFANGSNSQRFATGLRRFWPRWRCLEKRLRRQSARPTRCQVQRTWLCAAIVVASCALAGYGCSSCLERISSKAVLQELRRFSREMTHLQGTIRSHQKQLVDTAGVPSGSCGVRFGVCRTRLKQKELQVAMRCRFSAADS